MPTSEYFRVKMCCSYSTAIAGLYTSEERHILEHGRRLVGTSRRFVWGSGETIRRVEHWRIVSKVEKDERMHGNVRGSSSETHRVTVPRALSRKCQRVMAGIDMPSMFVGNCLIRHAHARFIRITVNISQCREFLGQEYINP